MRHGQAEAQRRFSPWRTEPPRPTEPLPNRELETLTERVPWTGSRRVRAWRGGDVRAVYYSVLCFVVLWGIVALGLAQPIVLLKLLLPHPVGP